MKEYEPKIPQNVLSVWEATARLSTEKIIYNGDILSRLAASTNETPLTLFVPWGVRPEGNFGEREQAALTCIQNYQSLLDTYAIASTVLIMPADVYAIEVNGYAWEPTTNYFNRVTCAAETKKFQVKPWSVIREENKETYTRILAGEASPESLWRSLPKSVWGDLLTAAYRRTKQKGDAAITKAAFDYLKERIAEARIIESVYRPIKLSMVSPKKDDVVDCDLPRLYLLPQSLRFPWIKGSMYEK